MFYYPKTARVGDFAGRCPECKDMCMWTCIPEKPIHENGHLGPAAAECQTCHTAYAGTAIEMKGKKKAAEETPEASETSTTSPNPEKRTRMAKEKKQRVYAETVTGTLKRGHLTATLGPKTLILGANGKGKTSIVTALTLAMFATALDTAGKDAETQGAAIFRHLSTGGAPVRADVKLSDGREYWYEKQDSKEADGAHLPEAARKAALPVLTLKDALTGSAATVRKWALEVSDRWLTLDTLRATIASHNATAILVVPKDEKSSATAWLEAQRVKAEESKKVAQDAARAADTNLKNLGAAAGMPVGDEALATAQAAVEGIAIGNAAGVTQEAHDAAVAAFNTAQASLTVALSNLEVANATYLAAQGVTASAAHDVQQAEGYVAQLKAAVDATPRNLPDAATLKTLQGLADFIPGHKNLFNGDCGLCGTHQADGAAYLARLDAILGAVEGMLNPPDPAAETRAQLTAWQAEHQRRYDAYLAAGKAAEAASAAVTHADHVVNQWQLEATRTRAESLKPVASGDVAAITAARAHLADLTRRKALHDQIAAARHTASGHREVETAAKQILEAIKEVSATLTKSALGLLEAEVSKYLPEGETFKLDLGDTFARVGIVKRGVFRSATSGAEEARMYAALACALSGPDISIVIPAERQWSPGTLRDVMRALAEAPCQVILISTVKPEGKIALKTWTVIDLGDAEDVDEVVEDPAQLDLPTAPVIDNTVAQVTHYIPAPPPAAAALGIAAPTEVVAPVAVTLPPPAVIAAPPAPVVAPAAPAAPSGNAGTVAPAWIPSTPPAFEGTKKNQFPPGWDGNARMMWTDVYATQTARYVRYADGVVMRCGVTGKISVWGNWA